jgi:hypothetical protein
VIPRLRHRLRRAGWLASLGLCLAGCVVIPYQPEPETRHELADVPGAELIRLSVGPRQFLEEMREAICKADPRIAPVDGQAFIDAAAPDGELTLARLLEPATGERIEPLAVDYLVLLGEPEDRELASRGGMVFYLGFFGLGESTNSSSYWAALVDLEQLRLVEQISSTATGTDRGVGLFYGLFIASDTRGGAQKGLVRDLVAGIAGVRPAGPVRIVLLASEAIRTAEDVAAAQRAERQARPFDPRSMDAYPVFAEPELPAADQGLIYLYRPEKLEGSLWPLALRQRSPAGEFEIVRLWSGGYLPLPAPTGQVELWVETDPTRVVALDVAPGGIYYLRASIRSWSLARIPSRLELVDPPTGRSEVVQCRRLPSTREYLAQTREAAEQGYTHKQLELAELYAAGIDYGPGEALARDDIEAYKWYSIVIAAEATRPEWASQAGRSRESLAARMTPEQLGEATRLAGEWLDASRQVE